MARAVGLFLALTMQPGKWSASRKILFFQRLTLSQRPSLIAVSRLSFQTSICRPLTIKPLSLQRSVRENSGPIISSPWGIKDGTYIRVSGTSRPAGRDLTAEMYYEDEGRSYDKVIRRDLTVTDEEIEELCRQMKEVAVANAKSESQKEAVKDVTKNVLLSWGLLVEAEERQHSPPPMGMSFCWGKMIFFPISNVECSKGKPVPVFVG